MTFYSGLFIGIALGFGLVIAFARYGNIRSKRRSDLLTWLNLQLDKIWPYVNEAASELISKSLEPILEQYRPAILASLKFTKFTLGTVAPQFTGVAIIESESDTRGVTMELEMQWDGNPNIKLDIKTRVGVALLYRLIFKPLVDEFPCFGAVSYSLREKKNLDFTLKIVGGEISTIPGISDAIEETIRDAIEDSITWPVRKIFPILPGDYSDLELKPVGTLEVKLVQAKDLTNKDIIGKSDPFTVLFIRPLRDRTKTSKTINNQLNPVWNEHFEFIVEDASTQHLTVRVFDDEGIQAPELIGCAQVPLKDLKPGALELLYCPFGTEISFKNPSDPEYSLTYLEKRALESGVDGTEVGDLGKTTKQKKRNVIVRGVLSVTVIAAEDLPAVDLMGKADPFVVLIMKKSETKAKTRVLSNTLNPAWNQTFEFVVEDALHDMLIVEVWDHDTFGKEKIGRVIMTLTRVVLEGEFQDSFPLDGAKSGKLYLHLKWSPELKFRDS
ncbi:hypothetical protein SLA2020_448860 [Shorea laevis]